MERTSPGGDLPLVPGSAHAHFECPARLALKFGFPCPGFDAAGGRIPSAWTGGELTAATCTAWKAFIARTGLTKARLAPAAPAF